jgi:Peptidase family S64
MKRSEVPSALNDAKQIAVERHLGKGRRHGHSWVVRAHPYHNVVGVGIGRKIKRGKALRAHSVRIYVEHKIPRRVIPPHLLLPERINGIITDVIEIGRMRAFVPAVPPAQRRRRPAQPGCSIGFQFPGAQAGELMAGTLGAIVASLDDGMYILSNNHVLANQNALPIGSPIFQPGLLDGGDITKDQIATLAKFIPLGTDKQNLVDCALAAITDFGGVIPRFLPGIGRLQGPEPIEAEHDMKVEKIGRATGYTTGIITDVSATMSVEFDDVTLQFVDQVLISNQAAAFSDGGDSGSLILDLASGRATALLIGGSPQCSIANHIEDVLSALKVTLVC